MILQRPQSTQQTGMPYRSNQRNLSTAQSYRSNQRNLSTAQSNRSNQRNLFTAQSNRSNQQTGITPNRSNLQTGIIQNRSNQRNPSAFLAPPNPQTPLGVYQLDPRDVDWRVIPRQDYRLGAQYLPTETLLFGEHPRNAWPPPMDPAVVSAGLAAARGAHRTRDADSRYGDLLSPFLRKYPNN